MLGKTIQAVILKECESGSPSNQVFCVFDGGTFFGFYSMSGEVMAAKGVKWMSLEEVRNYMGPECPNVLEASK